MYHREREIKNAETNKMRLTVMGANSGGVGYLET